MKISPNYHGMLVENLVVEMEWFKEEFEILFKSNLEDCTEIDKKIANDILDYILENTYVYDNIISHNLFDEVIENIEKMYPALFNSN